MEVWQPPPPPLELIELLFLHARASIEGVRLFYSVHSGVTEYFVRAKCLFELPGTLCMYSLFLEYIKETSLTRLSVKNNQKTNCISIISFFKKERPHLIRACQQKVP